MWQDFCAHVHNAFGGKQDYVGVLVAWNGKSCDMEWVYKFIHASTDNSCAMPPQIEYFMDPYQIIKKYKGCDLHPLKSKIQDLSLSTVYKYVTGHSSLPGAHNSLVDCKAQGIQFISLGRTAGFVVQGTIWKDKRIVGWLHTLDVEPGTLEAKQRSRGSSTTAVFDAPPVQKSYSTKFNGVDLSDKDSAKYSTSLRTNRWYLCVFFWLLDRAVHSCFIIATSLASDDFMKEWKVYSSKHNGRKKFQTHLGIALINKGIEMDWKAPYNAEDKPAWMPKTIKNGKYHPCDCGICFFCKNGKTSTIAHGKVTSQPRVKKCSGKYD